MDDKTYFPEIVPDNPFPGEPEPALLPSQPNPAGTFSPTTDKPKSFPKKRIATELLSTALNTRSRKILESFDLEQRGAMQVGNFKEGISGDLRITPNGLTARNISGLTTLAVDGGTGDAIFLGTLRAGTLIGGDGTVLIEESLAGNGRIVLYNSGLPAILIGDPDE